MELDPKYLAFALEPAVSELINNEDYNEAINMIKNSKQEYTPALIKNEAYCYFKQKKYLRALEVIKLAEEKGWCLPDILALKGQCLYFLEEWETAFLTFEALQELKSSSDVKLWLDRCKIHMMFDRDHNSDNVFVYEPSVITEVKKEWYQTPKQVVLRLLVKAVKEEELEVTFNVKSIDVTIKQKKPIIVHVDLSKEIIPEQSNYKINHSSVELNLQKAHPNSNWNL